MLLRVRGWRLLFRPERHASPLMPLPLLLRHVWLQNRPALGQPLLGKAKVRLLRASARARRRGACCPEGRS